MFVSKLFLCLACLAFGCIAETIQGFVIGVTDGDTLKIVDAARRQYTIRLYGVDAPESHQAFGQKSKQKLSSLVFQRNVQVVCHNQDQYGRTVGTVFWEKTNINLAMIRCGLAWHYVQYAPKNTDFAEAQRSARAKGMGLWADPHPQPPWEFRKAKRVRKEGTLPF